MAVSPDKPHAYRRRKITRDNCYKAGCRDHGLQVGRAAPLPCDVCGGSKSLAIHDVEAARFRRRYMGAR